MFLSLAKQPKWLETCLILKRQGFFFSVFTFENQMT